jgi:BolA protein
MVLARFLAVAIREFGRIWFQFYSGHLYKLCWFAAKQTRFGGMYMTSDRPMANAVANTIRTLLEQALSPERLDIRDDSDRHIGHAGHSGAGESHFHVMVVSEAFEGVNRPARHRMIYDALGSLMKERVHALSIKALTPAEADTQNATQ